MRHRKELKLPSKVSVKATKFLQAYGFDEIEDNAAKQLCAVPAAGVPLPTYQKPIRLPLSSWSSWWRAPRKTKVPRPESTKAARKVCYEPPPKWKGNTQRNKNKPVSVVSNAESGLETPKLRSVFDVAHRKATLKSFGKERTDSKRLSQDSTREADPALNFQEPQEDQRVALWELHGLARDVNMKVEDVISIKEIFDSFDEDKTGTLELEEFQNVAMGILSSQLRKTTQAKQRVLQLCERNFALMDSDGSGSLDFQEFLRWYSSRSFSESLLLTDAERDIRELAKKCGLDANTVDKVKEYFDAADTDGSGNIQFTEFAEVLPRMLKLPAGFELPESRIRHFWSEADTDHDETIVFSEFLTWWCKYLTGETNVQDFVRVQNAEIVTNFYRSLRHMGKMKFDPPPEIKPTQDDSEEELVRSSSTFYPSVPM